MDKLIELKCKSNNITSTFSASIDSLRYKLSDGESIKSINMRLQPSYLFWSEITLHVIIENKYEIIGKTIFSFSDRSQHVTHWNRRLLNPQFKKFKTGRLGFGNVEYNQHEVYYDRNMFRDIFNLLRRLPEVDAEDIVDIKFDIQCIDLLNEYDQKRLVVDFIDR